MGVQLNIKSAKARRLAEQLSEVTGESITEAVTVALDQRLRSLDKRQRRLELDKILLGSRMRWKGAMLSLDHGDLLYDEFGLPR